MARLDAATGFVYWQADTQQGAPVDAFGHLLAYTDGNTVSTVLAYDPATGAPLGISRDQWGQTRLIRQDSLSVDCGIHAREWQRWRGYHDLYCPEHPQHVIQRGNNRQECFCDASDYQFYLDKLYIASAKHACEIHAYVLMTKNHVHLLVTPRREDGIGKMMQMLDRYYVQFYNYCYKRTGTLWEGRYKATLIDSEAYLLTRMRYIELNPVRAQNMVEHPAQYPWSSYQHNALGREDSLVTPHQLYQHLGKTGEERQSAYRQLFRAKIPDRILDEIRHATNKAWALGNNQFKRRIEAQLKHRIEPKAKGGDRKSAKREINRV